MDWRRIYWVILGLGVASFPSRAADELPPALKADLARIELRLRQATADAPKTAPERIDLTVTELSQEIDEFALDAELLDDDPRLMRLWEGVERLRKVADAARTNATSAAPTAMPKAKPPTREELDALVKIPVDLANVSFKKDVAPILAGVCLGCHNPNRKSGEFDASTFKSFAAQLTPGDPEGSHILRLVTGKEEPRMPRGGQTRFSKEWADIWTAWIKQGAKFDGPNEAAPITGYLIDREAQRRAAFARMPDDVLDRLHQGHSRRQWEIVRPRATVVDKTTKNLLVVSTLSESDTEYAAVLAEAVLEELEARHRSAERQAPWRGRLGLNLFLNRADYVAFCQQIDRFVPESTEYGHYRATPDHQYVALTIEGPLGLDAAVAQKVAEAYYRRLGEEKTPEWAAFGLARLVAMKNDPKNQAWREEQAQARNLVREGKTVADLFAQRLPWTQQAPLAATFFTYLQHVDKKGLAGFAKTIAKSGEAEKAARDSFRASPDALQRSFTAWLASTRAGKKS